MTFVFLVLVFTGHNGYTTAITTPMPSMEVCERMLDYHMTDLPRPSKWSDSGIDKPKEGHCKKITTEE